MLEIKKRTRKFRAITASAFLRILTPTFYSVAKKTLVDYETKECQFPRPSTKLIHGIYGEKPLVGVEIGTGFGENALSLLRELSIERLYCVDPFVPYADGEIKIQTDYLLKSEYTLKTLSKFKNVTFIRKDSSKAWKEIPKNLDFVYIDGHHGYDHVLADLQNYYPLTAENGVIAGHDIDWPSVHKALGDFCRVNTIVPILLSPDWIMIKQSDLLENLSRFQGIISQKSGIDSEREGTITVHCGGNGDLREICQTEAHGP